MKKMIYLVVLALLAINYSCDKDDVQEKEPEVKTFQARTGLGGDNGDVYDGTSDTNALPNGGTVYIYLVEFAPGLTVYQKNMIRLPYQAEGDLIYFEQCPDYPDREFWHMNPDVYYGCPNDDCSNSRTDHPPKKNPNKLREVWYQTFPSCYQ